MKITAKTMLVLLGLVFHNFAFAGSADGTYIAQKTVASMSIGSLEECKEANGVWGEDFCAVSVEDKVTIKGDVIEAETWGTNLHSCGFSGKIEQASKLTDRVFLAEDQDSCKLMITIKDAKLNMEAVDNEACAASCGANAWLFIENAKKK